MRALSNEDLPSKELSLKELSKSRGGLWSLIAGAAIISGGITLATLDSAQSRLDKIDRTEECAVDTLTAERPSFEAILDSTVILQTIDMCAEKNDARISESVRNNMVDPVRREVYDRVTSSGR